LLVQGKGSQYFQVHQHSDGGLEEVPIDGDAAWAQVGEQMAKAWVNVEMRAQNTIQEGEKDEVNPWVERTQWLPYPRAPTGVSPHSSFPGYQIYTCLGYVSVMPPSLQ
jgi:hypothetical protein